MSLIEHDDAKQDAAVAALYAFAQKRWGWGSHEYADVQEAVEVVRATDHTGGAISDEAAQRFRDALTPGYIVWHDGKRLSSEDMLTQIKRGLIAATGGQ